MQNVTVDLALRALGSARLSIDRLVVPTLVGFTEVCLVAEIIGVTLESSGIVRVEREGYISSVTGRVPHRALWTLTSSF